VSRPLTRASPGYILVPVILAISLIGLVALLLNREGSIDVNMAAGSAQADRARYVAEAGFSHQRWRLDQASCDGYTALASTPFGNDTYSATVTPTQGTPVTITATAVLADGSTRTYGRADVPVYGDPETVVIQPGGRDTWLNSGSPTFNYGVDTELEVDGDLNHALVWFDLSSIPAEARVTSADLGLSLQGLSGPSMDVSVHRATQSWQEGSGSGSATGDGATWNTRDGAVAWSTAGGDYDVAAASTTVSAPGPYTWDVTGIVDDWARGGVPNEGLLLRGASSSGARFASDEHATAGDRPMLTVTYTCRCDACQPGGTLTPVADTFLRHNAPQGGLADLKLGQDNSRRNLPSLLRFDVLSSIPPNVTIDSATLRVYEYQQAGSTFTVNAHKITQAWVESQANWDDASTGTPWTGGSGGTYDPTVIDFTTVNTGVGWREWDIAPLVQEWVDGLAPDYGVQLVHTGAGKGDVAVYRSRESASGNPPQLVITYTP
jgi:hypothetical protein